MEKQATIGFVGLGVMGLPIASHLIAAGHRVGAFNRSRPSLDALTARGAVAAENLAHLGTLADVVITMVPDFPDVDDVLFRPEGLVSTLRPGSLVIDCSTIAPAAAVSIGERLADAGLRFVDAPVSGGEAGAIAGTLAIMIGGEDAAVADAKQILEVFASVIAHVGPTGSGQLVKAANQMLVAGNLAVVSEALAFLQRTHVDLNAALIALNSGLAASRVLEVKAPKMLARDFTPGFRLDLHYKDLMIALSAAEQAKIAVPVTGLVTQLVQALRSAGDGGLDHAAMLRAIERLSAVSP